MRSMVEEKYTETEGYLTGDYERPILSPIQWPAHEIFPDDDERRKDLRNQVIRQGNDLRDLLPELDKHTKYRFRIKVQIEEIEDQQVWDVIFEDGSQVQVMAHDEINARRQATRKHNGTIDRVEK